MTIFQLAPMLEAWHALQRLPLMQAALAEALNGGRGPIEAARCFSYATLKLDKWGRGAALAVVAAHAARIDTQTVIRTWQIFDRWALELRRTVAA